MSDLGSHQQIRLEALREAVKFAEVTGSVHQDDELLGIADRFVEFVEDKKAAVAGSSVDVSAQRIGEISSIEMHIQLSDDAKASLGDVAEKIRKAIEKADAAMTAGEDAIRRGRKALADGRTDLLNKGRNAVITDMVRRLDEHIALKGCERRRSDCFLSDDLDTVQLQLMKSFIKSFSRPVVAGRMV